MAPELFIYLRSQSGRKNRKNVGLEKKLPPRRLWSLSSHTDVRKQRCFIEYIGGRAIVAAVPHRPVSKRSIPLLLTPHHVVFCILVWLYQGQMLGSSMMHNVSSNASGAAHC
jgi:hypothetical protein